MSQQSMGSGINFSFDPNQHEIWGSGGDFLQESGTFPVVIRNADISLTADAQSYKTVFTLEIIAGHLKGRKFDDTLNIHNKSDTVKANALKQLASYCTAIGHNAVLNDLNVLYNRPFQLTVEASQEPSQKDPNRKYWKNSVKKWHYADGKDIVHGQFANQQQQQVVYNGEGSAAAPSLPGSAAPSAPQAPVTQQQAPAAQAQVPGGYAPQQQAAPAMQTQQASPAMQQQAPAFGAPAGQAQAAPAFGAPAGQQAPAFGGGAPSFGGGPAFGAPQQ